MVKKDEKKSKKKKKKDDKSKKKSKKSKKSKKTKKAKNKKDSKKKKKKKKVSSSSSDSSDDSSGESDASENGEEIWIEKNADNPFRKPDAIKSKSKKSERDDGDDESQVGPSVRNTSGLSHKDFGHALLPGEGAAMVSYSYLSFFFLQFCNLMRLKCVCDTLNFPFFFHRRLILQKENVFPEEVKSV